MITADLEASLRETESDGELVVKMDGMRWME